MKEKLHFAGKQIPMTLGNSSLRQPLSRSGVPLLTPREDALRPQAAAQRVRESSLRDLARRRRRFPPRDCSGPPLRQQQLCRAARAAHLHQPSTPQVSGHQMEYTEVVSANPSSSLEVSFRWSTELTHEEFTRSQARATGHRLPRTAHFPSPLLRAALQIQFCVRNAESGDAVALYDLKLSDVRKQVRASLPQKRAPRSGPSSPSEYGSHPAPRTATLRVPLRPPGSVHVSR